MERIKVLRQRLADLLIEAEKLADKVADGTISADEQTRLDAIMDTDVPAAKKAIATEEKLMEARRAAPAPAAAAAAEPAAEPGKVPAEAKAEVVKFTSFGEQLRAVARAGMNRGVPFAQVDNRLIYQAAPSGANEAVPSEGGFLVQQDFSTNMLELMHDQGEVLQRVRRVPIGAQFNGIKFPIIDETSRADGSRWGGVQAYWADEADTVTASKPKFRQMELSLKKLMAIAYATDELLADTSALESIMTSAFTEELVFKTEDSIVNGTGAGQPLGFLKSGALITINPESGQAASTIRTENILKMWARTPIRSRRSLVWMCNQDIEPELWGLTLGSGTAVRLLYTPPTDGNPYGLLLGRPVIPVEYAASLGTVGDLVLWDPQSYLMIDKNSVAQAASMHVRFLNDEMTFRFTFRVDGQPVQKSPITPKNGSNTISPYVALATR